MDASTSEETTESNQQNSKPAVAAIVMILVAGSIVFFANQQTESPANDNLQATNDTKRSSDSGIIISNQPYDAVYVRGVVKTLPSKAIPILFFTSTDGAEYLCEGFLNPSNIPRIKVGDAVRVTGKPKNYIVGQTKKIKIHAISPCIVELIDSPNKEVSSGGDPSGGIPVADIIRNEPYAKHGLIFKRQDLQTYFEQQPWYKPVTKDHDTVEAMLSPAEQDQVSQAINMAKNR